MIMLALIVKSWLLIYLQFHYFSIIYYSSLLSIVTCWGLQLTICMVILRNRFAKSVVFLVVCSHWSFCCFIYVVSLWPDRDLLNVLWPRKVFVFYNLMIGVAGKPLQSEGVRTAAWACQPPCGNAGRQPHRLWRGWGREVVATLSTLLSLEASAASPSIEHCLVAVSAWSDSGVPK